MVILFYLHEKAIYLLWTILILVLWSHAVSNPTKCLLIHIIVVWPSRYGIKWYKRILDLNWNPLLILTVWCNIFVFFFFFDMAHRLILYYTLCHCIDESDSSTGHRIYYITLNDPLRKISYPSIQLEAQWVHNAYGRTGNGCLQTGVTRLDHFL